jgi:hypothetical protein
MRAVLSPAHHHCHRFHRRIRTPASRLRSIARASRSATSSPPNGPPCSFLASGMAQSSLSRTRHRAGPPSSRSALRHPHLPSRSLRRAITFAISLRNSCARPLVCSWPGLAVGRRRPPRCRDVVDTGASWPCPSPSLCSLGRRPWADAPSRTGSSSRAGCWGRIWPWAGSSVGPAR